jgi:TPR repeat protein
MSSVTMARTVSAALTALLFFCLPSFAAQTDEIAPGEAEKRAFAAGTPAEAVRWLEIAAKGGQRDAQTMLGDFYARGTVGPKNIERAIELLRAAAAQGAPRAQSLLGWIYSGGGGGKRDEAEAFKWLVAAARQEDGYALLRLSEFYSRGIVVAADQSRARRLLVRAAELGESTAVKAAWQVLLVGRPEDRNSPLGMHFLTKAAHADDAHSAYVLGREYLTGRDVPRDHPRAVRWFKRAATAQHALASLWLSEMHAKGLGVQQDAARAEEMLQTALRSATIRDKNHFSWTLVVNPDAQLRNSALAIRVLEPALAAEQQKSPAHLDTLAAAYAEHGEFDKAVATQLEAIRTWQRTRPTESAPDMEQRLQLYRASKLYREDTP